MVEERKLYIGEVAEGDTKVNILARVLRKFVKEIESDGGTTKMARVLLGDKTGTIWAVFWDPLASRVENINVGDVVKVIDARATKYNDRLELSSTYKTRLITGMGVKEDPRLPEVPGMEHFRELLRSYRPVKISEILAGESPRYVSVVGTIVRVYSIKHIRKNEDGSDVVVLEFAMDDDTDVIRAVAFNETAAEILGKPMEKIIEEFESVFEEVGKTFSEAKAVMAKRYAHIVGNEVEIHGRVTENEKFGKVIYINEVTCPDYDAIVSSLQ